MKRSMIFVLAAVLSMTAHPAWALLEDGLEPLSTIGEDLGGGSSEDRGRGHGRDHDEPSQPEPEPEPAPAPEPTPDPNSAPDIPVVDERPRHDNSENPHHQILPEPIAEPINTLIEPARVDSSFSQGEQASALPSMIEPSRIQSGGDVSSSIPPPIFDQNNQIATGKKSWDISQAAVPGPGASSVRQVFVGKIVSIDENKNRIVLKDRRQNVKTMYVDESAMPLLKKGSTIQTTFRTGSNKAETVQPIFGG